MFVSGFLGDWLIPVYNITLGGFRASWRHWLGFLGALGSDQIQLRARLSAKFSTTQYRSATMTTDFKSNVRSSICYC